MFWGGLLCEVQGLRFLKCFVWDISLPRSDQFAGTCSKLNIPRIIDEDVALSGALPESAREQNGCQKLRVQHSDGKPTHAADKAWSCCQGKNLVEAVCLSSSLRFLEASGDRRRKLWSCGTIAAAVGSLMMRRMFMPEMVPASTGLGLQTGFACSLKRVSDTCEPNFGKLKSNKRAMPVATSHD